MVTQEITEWFASRALKMGEIDLGYMGGNFFGDIHSESTQSLIKEYIYFLLEEIGEFIEAAWYKEIFDNDAMLDELADILGFTHILANRLGIEISKVQLSNIQELSPEHTGLIPINAMIARDPITMKAMVLGIIYEWTMVGNLLKNRRWKKENYLVDHPVFTAQVLKAYTVTIQTIFDLGFSFQQIQQAFDKKIEANLLRIASNY